MDDIEEQENEEKTEKQSSNGMRAKLEYKQIVIIILLTTIMIMLSLGACSVMVSYFETKQYVNYNTLVIKEVEKVDPTDPTDPTYTGGISKNKKFVFEYMENDIVENGIMIYNMFPTPDSVGRKFTGVNYTFDFTLVFGKKSKDHYYEITAEKQGYSNVPDRLVKVYLERDGNPVGESLDNGEIKRFSKYSNATINPVNGNEKKIYSGTISESDLEKGAGEFTLRMWLAQDADFSGGVLNNKKFGVKVNVYAN